MMPQEVTCLLKDEVIPGRLGVFILMNRFVHSTRVDSEAMCH